MKKYIVCFCAISLLGFSACEKEEALTPSNKDNDGPRIEALLDRTNTILPIGKYKDDYGVTILYKFDEILDFKFGVNDLPTRNKWDNLKVTQCAKGEISYLDPNTGTYRDTIVNTQDYALRYMRDSIFRYFQDEITFNGITYRDCPANKKLLPRKILIAHQLEQSENGGSIPADTYNTESDFPEGGSSITAIGNSQMFMLAVDSVNVTNQRYAHVKMNMRNIKLYTLICHMLEKNKLYQTIPTAFFSPVEQYYDSIVDNIANRFTPLPVVPPSRPNQAAKYYSPDWYIGLGMAITMKSPNPTLKTASYQYEQRIDINYPQGMVRFPDKQRDFRNFICLMIFQTQTPASPTSSNSNLARYLNPENTIFKARMRIAIETMLSWGINVIEINPELKAFFD